MLRPATARHLLQKNQPDQSDFGEVLTSRRLREAAQHMGNRRLGRRRHIKGTGSKGEREQEKEIIKN